jgi:hypothetical protein
MSWSLPLFAVTAIAREQMRRLAPSVGARRRLNLDHSSGQAASPRDLPAGAAGTSMQLNAAFEHKS